MVLHLEAPITCEMCENISVSFFNVPNCIFFSLYLLFPLFENDFDPK